MGPSTKEYPTINLPPRWIQTSAEYVEDIYGNVTYKTTARKIVKIVLDRIPSNDTSPPDEPIIRET